jgi:hypothetical protein
VLPAHTLEAAPVRGAGEELDATPPALVGYPAPLLTLRFFNVLAEVNALGGNDPARALRKCANACRHMQTSLVCVQPERETRDELSIVSFSKRTEPYRLLATLESSRSADVFGVIETTM